VLEAAGAVVLADGATGVQVLVVHRPRYDDWTLPKGRLEAGERPADAALREVTEETGVTVRIVGALPPTTYPVPEGDKTVHWFAAVPHPTAAGPAGPVDADEVDEVRWVGQAEAIALLTHPQEHDLVRTAIADRQDPRPARPRIAHRGVRLAQEVTPAAVGERVSVRALTTEPGRGPVPTDVVGRLVGADDEALLVVGRDGRLHVIAAGDVLASRLVPPHPRLTPEPHGGTRDAPLPREAARALVLDPDGRTLLVAHHPGDGRRVWTAPGGGLDPGEEHRAAAARELAEEIGITPPLGPCVWTREVIFAFHGVWIDQRERWFVTHVDGLDPTAVPLGDVGTSQARWWSVEELASTDEELAPSALAVHLECLLREGPPVTPADVGR
jgi:8-oxo-dGTP pyrophosphatase MutT (NUDIX family)